MPGANAVSAPSRAVCVMKSRRDSSSFATFRVSSSGRTQVTDPVDDVKHVGEKTMRGEGAASALAPLVPAVQQTSAT
jgi:hypothetical protein